MSWSIDSIYLRKVYTIYGWSKVELEQGGAGVVRVRVRSHNVRIMVNFCAVVGCSNRSDREKEISFYRLPCSRDFSSR